MTQPMEFNAELLAQLRRDAPELAAVMDRAAAGELNVGEAMSAMSDLLEGSLDLTTYVAGMAAGGRAMVESARLPRLNPVYEAALWERLQYDDDAPELRTGALPHGVKPAVPVDTLARSPVAIGVALAVASAAVADAASTMRQDHAIHLEGLALAAPDPAPTTDLALASDPLGALLARGPEDPAGYARGEMPMPLAVPMPSGESIATMAPADRQLAAWRSTATTQGRQTALRAIAEALGGKAVPPTAFLSSAGEVSRATWAADLAEAAETHAGFSAIDVAIAVLRTRLAPHVQSGTVIEVTTLDAYADRRVGWAARVMRV